MIEANRFSSIFLPFGYGEVSTPKSLRHIGTKDKTDCEYRGRQGIHVDVAEPARQFSQIVEQHLATKENQEHEHQFGYTPDDADVGLSQDCQEPVRRQTRSRGEYTKQARQY